MITQTQTTNAQHAEQSPTAEEMLNELEAARASYLDARSELQTVADQVARNKQSLDAALTEASELNQQWRNAVHQSGLKSSGKVRKLLDASIEAKGNADRLAMLVEEGPAMLDTTREQTADARKRYLQTLSQLRGPILEAKAESGLSALKQIEGLPACFAELNAHLRNLYDSFLVEYAPYFNIRHGTSAQDDERDLKQHAKDLTIRIGLVPFLQELGLNLDADIPEGLKKLPLLPIEDATTWG